VSSRRRHTRSKRDWSSDVCSSDLTSGDNPRNEWKANPYANLLGQKAPGLLLQNLKPTSDENAAQCVDGAVHGSPGRWRTDAPDKIGRASCRERVKNYMGGSCYK